MMCGGFNNERATAQRSPAHVLMIDQAAAERTHSLLLWLIVAFGAAGFPTTCTVPIELKGSLLDTPFWLLLLHCLRAYLVIPICGTSPVCPERCIG